MKKNLLPAITLLLCSLASSLAQGATDWSTQDYDLYPGDFNHDGHADIFLQSTTPGDNYLLLADARGNINGISETVPNNTQGLVWSADQHRIIAGDFNGD